MLLKMAILSGLRRPKRAILIIMAVALSVFVMEFVSGWVLGMRERMQRKITEESAHLLVESKARFASLDPFEPRNYLDDPDSIAGRFLKDGRVERVERVTPFGALVLSGQKNLPLRMYAVEADTSFFSQVSRGRIKGGFPFAGPGIAISERALALLGSPAAGSLMVLVEDAFGAPSYREFRIGCVFRTDDSDFDSSTAFVDAESATALLGVTGAAELWIRLRDPAQAEQVGAANQAFMDDRGCVARTWSTLEGSLLVFLRLMDLFMAVIKAVVLIVAATVITNAILMNVFEKQREYGTLRAIGMRRREQAGLVLLEGGAQGLMGALLGALLAFPLILYLKGHGLAIGEASRLFGGGDVMFFGSDPMVTLRNVGVGTLIALLGSVYAAIAGTRATVVDALKGA